MDFVGFTISFIVFICLVAIIIIGAKWLLSLTGVAIPQPLLVILGILVFLMLLVIFLNLTGLHHFRFSY